MKILYDHQIFEAQKIGGISRYFCEIIQRLDATAGVQVALPLRFSQNEYLKNTRFSGNMRTNLDAYEHFMGGREFRGKWGLYVLKSKIKKPVDSAQVNRQLVIDALRKQDFDVFHPTYYDDYFLPYIGNKPFVLTVYDMIHEIYPEYYNLTDRTSERKRRLAHKAHKIIAISECTKKDLVQIFGVPAEKVEVIHLASALDTHHGGPPVLPATLPARYVLFVGARTVYKNFFFFINSMRTLLDADPALHIVCTGGPFSPSERAFFALHGLAERVHQHRASDAELHLLYQRAEVFVFPSLYEGFGLPVLEAFDSGCPTVLGNAGSLPEIGGDGALYFEPKDARSVHQAMHEALYNPASRAELVARGKRRLAQFSWDQTSQETARVYRSLLA